jgi:hypothetical protein
VSESLLQRLLARVTGRRVLERMAAVEDKVGAFGRSQRETLNAHGRRLDELNAALPTRASTATIRALERRLEDLQQQVKHQDRTVSDALERARLLDELGMDDRRFTRRIEEILRHDRPVIVGPWTGEVGFELIYWIPFVRWVARTYNIPPERLWVVSRGGTDAWYGDLAAHYVDAFEFVTPDEFRAATQDAKKQRRVGAFDAELVKRVTTARALGRPDLLHPGMMYRLLMPFWKDVASIARVEARAIYTPLASPDDPAVADLPREFVAARFYFSECFPETPANRAFVSSTLDELSRHTPVVLLNTPFAVDDHRDAEAGNGRVLSVGTHMSPPRNLALQTAVIARARAFVGTYGGYAYLAPLLGVSALAFYSERSFKVHHLQVAQHVCARLERATLTTVDVAAAPLVRMALANGGPATA